MEQRTEFLISNILIYFYSFIAWIANFRNPPAPQAFIHYALGCLIVNPTKPWSGEIAC